MVIIRPHRARPSSSAVIFIQNVSEDNTLNASDWIRRRLFDLNEASLAPDLIFVSVCVCRGGGGEGGDSRGKHRAALSRPWRSAWPPGGRHREANHLPFLWASAVDVAGADVELPEIRLVGLILEMVLELFFFRFFRRCHCSLRF